MSLINCKRKAPITPVLAFTALLCLGLFAGSASADQVQYSVDINTSAISGASAQLTFDFIAGGSTSNSMTISSFFTDGTLGAVSPSGSVSGTLPGDVTLTTSSFFNEYLTNITLGTDISFLLTATNNAPASGIFPDAFSLTVLDPVTGLPLFATSDPSGADTLAFLNLDGSPGGSLSTSTALKGEVVLTATSTAVPEPGTLLLLASGLAILFCSFGARPRRPGLSASF